MVRLLVVEDHALVREGLVQTLRRLDDHVEVFSAADSEAANGLLEREAPIDLILLDLGLPGVDGFSCLRAFNQRYPSIPVVILSAYDDPHTVNKVMKSGAASFVSKSYSGERMLSVLRDVLSGQVLFPELQAGALGSSPMPNPVARGLEPAEFGLSERKSQVLALMASGKSNREIAELLGLSEGTVKVHMTGIFKALGVSSRTQAMVVISRYQVKL